MSTFTFSGDRGGGGAGRLDLLVGVASDVLDATPADVTGNTIGLFPFGLLIESNIV